MPDVSAMLPWQWGAVAAVALIVIAHFKTSRADGILVGKVHPYRRLMWFVMPTRNECVVYYEDKNVAGAGAGTAGAATTPTKGGLRPNPAYEASRILLDMAGVVLRQHKPKRRVTVTFGGE